MRATTRRRIAVPAAIASGLLVSGLLVWQTSNAAFTATTGNTANTFQSGSVTLTDNDNGSALFSATALKPGSQDTRCIVVTYSGSLPSTVRLSAAFTDNTPASTALAPHLYFRIEEVSNGAESCAAATPTREFATSATMLSDKVNALAAPGVPLSWTPAGGAAESKRYRFSYELEDNNAAQAKSANVGFTWTATGT